MVIVVKYKDGKVDVYDAGPVRPQDVQDARERAFLASFGRQGSPQEVRDHTDTVERLRAI